MLGLGLGWESPWEPAAPGVCWGSGLGFIGVEGFRGSRGLGSIGFIGLRDL